MKIIMILIITIVMLTTCSAEIYKDKQNKPAVKHKTDITDHLISYQDKQKLIQYAYSVLDSSFNKRTNPVKKVPQIKDYDKVFITFMHSNKVRCYQSGSSKRKNQSRTKLDVAEAVVRCIKDKRFGGILTEKEISGVDVVINVLYDRKQVFGNLKQLADQIELGIHAIEINIGKKKEYFKESVPITKNYKLKNLFEKLCKKVKQSRNCYNSKETKIFKYNTITFLGNRKSQITNLYRYNVPIPFYKINKDFLYNRIKLVNSWFLNNINDETKTLEYTYFPSKNKYSPKNNHVRQIATLWSMVELKDFLGDSSITSLANRTFDYYLKRAKCSDIYCYIKLKGKSKLAFNAFLILALLKSPGYPKSEKWLKLLGNGILLQQKADGSYKTYYNSNRMTGIDYYPGEAMLALIRLYQKTGHHKYLESIKKAFPYYRNYWRNNKNTAFIPWHSQVYLPLYRATKNTDIPKFVFEMNDWLIDNYQIKSSRYPDKIGGFPKPIPRNSTGSYLESINDAYALAKITGDKDHISKYKESIQLGAHFILLLQFTKENSFYIKNQKRVVGGFRHSLTSNTQRNDFTQHALMALMKTYHNQIFD